MDVLVVADGYYYQTPDGTVYADSVYDYNFYKRYLQAFDHVYALVRAMPVIEAPKGKMKSSGEGVSFLLLPFFRGPIQYFMKYYSIYKAVRKYCKNFNCAVFRIPAATSNIVCNYYSRLGKPFAVEVVADPWENFGPRAEGNKILLFIVRHNWTQFVRLMCLKANGASYVTKHYLQEKYHPKAIINGRDGFTAAFSSVELEDNSFATPRLWNSDQKAFLVSHVANNFSGYGKGHLTLMNAVKIVRDHGYDVHIRFVGDGARREDFENYARNLGIGNYVEFTGRLANGDAVREIIKNSDIFVLPTFSEGLPRVLLEAMSEGIPCLSSPISGIPEILGEEYLFDFSDAAGFAKGIEAFITNTKLMSKESKHNLEIAKCFASSILNKRRTEFYCKLRTIAE